MITSRIVNIIMTCLFIVEDSHSIKTIIKAKIAKAQIFLLLSVRLF